MNVFKLKRLRRDLSNSEHSDTLKLLFAIQGSDVEQICEILTTNPILINTPCGSLHASPLHMACACISKEKTKIVKLLLSYGANVQYSDKLGRTALHYAVIRCNLQLIMLLLEYGANVNAKYATGYSRKISLPEVDEHGIFNCLPLPASQGQTPLHLAFATKKYRRKIIKVLLDHNADANAMDEHKITPILLAGVTTAGLKEYEEIISLLIEYRANVNVFISYTGSSALHHSVALNSLPATEALINAGAKIHTCLRGQTPVHVAAAKGHYDILRCILNRLPVDINQPDFDGRTALHKAAFAGSTECVKIIVERGGDLSANSNTDITVMDVLFSHVPKPVQLITDLLNSNVSSKGVNNKGYNVNHRGCNLPDNDLNFKINLDFSILVPKSTNNQMAVITALLDAGTRHQSIHLLQHPLIETFLCLKWDRLKIFYIILIFMHLLFVVNLSTYVILIIHRPLWADTLITATRINVLAISAILLLGEFIQIFQYIFGLRNILRQYEIWINVCCSVSSTVIATIGLFEENQDKPPPNWILHTTSFIVLLAWIELMLLIGRHPKYGYFVLMFHAVLQNVVKVFLTFICLVIGFSISFCIQFHTSDQFKNPWNALIKTISMTMGEYEYADIFHTEDVLVLPFTSSIIFVLFVILSSIVLMNLMLGVAVNDIYSLQQIGHAQSLAKQSSFISQLEIFLSNRFLVNWMPTKLYNILKNRCSLRNSLVIRPELVATGNVHISRQMKCIPTSVIDSLVQLITSNCCEKKTSFIDEISESVMILFQQINDRLEMIENKLENAKHGIYTS